MYAFYILLNFINIKVTVICYLPKMFVVKKGYVIKSTPNWHKFINYIIKLRTMHVFGYCPIYRSLLHFASHSLFIIHSPYIVYIFRALDSIGSCDKRLIHVSHSSWLHLQCVSTEVVGHCAPPQLLHIPHIIIAL